MALTDADITTISRALGGAEHSEVPRATMLAEAIADRLRVFRAADWNGYVEYVQRTSVFGKKADLGLRDKEHWEMDMAYWAQAELIPEALEVHITRKNGGDVWQRSEGSHTTRNDDGLYSATPFVGGRETVARVEIPAKVLDTIPMDKLVDAAMTIDFVLTDAGTWVPLRTGVWFPPAYDNPGIPPWL